jgi:hypothetical protein
MNFELEDVTGVVVIGLLAVAAVLALADIETVMGFEVLAAGESAVGYLAAGNFSVGVLSAGMFSVGIFSAGIFSVGVFAIGIFSIGIFSFGIYAAGFYAVRRQIAAAGAAESDQADD